MKIQGTIRKLKCEQEKNNTPSVDIAYSMAIDALEKQEKITNLLKCHDDFSKETFQVNYELVKAIRKILEID